jgi:hypothetical protein
MKYLQQHGMIQAKIFFKRISGNQMWGNKIKYKRKNRKRNNHFSACLQQLREILPLSTSSSKTW